jgi:hypothetical protein
MACAIDSVETAIVVAGINGPTPTSEQWRICGIYSPGADAGYVSTN